MALETLVYSPLSYLTRLIARERFIQSRPHVLLKCSCLFQIPQGKYTQVLHKCPNSTFPPFSVPNVYRYVVQNHRLWQVTSLHVNDTGIQRLKENGEA
jgi:hypothetical protein